MQSSLLRTRSLSLANRIIGACRALVDRVGTRTPPGPPPPTSDVRLKTDIRRIGTGSHNLPLYTFRYVGEEGVYQGVMAQDVLHVVPAAVSVAADGFYRVNYKMLGIEFRRLR